MSREAAPQEPCVRFVHRGRPADVARLDRPVLLALIATEEEFDWDGEFSPSATSTSAIDALPVAQTLLRRHGLVPTYALDHPVASQRGDVFRAWADAGECEIGAHLHPWVNPPHVETVGGTHSFPGNLGPAIERAKLEELVATIERGTGRRPFVYQAGRYGIAPHTPSTLAELGFRVDTSVAPPFDYTDEGGPNYAHFPNGPYWQDGVDGLLEVPVTGAYVGSLARTGAFLYPKVRGEHMDRLRVGGVLSRFGLLERSRLSPEGHDARDMKRLVQHLAARGNRVFTFYFHSPTVAPGCTEYVRDERELQRFLDESDRFLSWFLGEFGGEAWSYSRLYETLAR
ncbi:MAG: WalW protein [Planctomycetota bacterium]